MSILYAVIEQDAWQPQYEEVFPSVTEAAKHAGGGSYVVAVENDKVRPLSVDEEREYQAILSGFGD